MESLRSTTLIVVESACQLREELNLARNQSASQQRLDPLPILYNSQDYLAKITSDLAVLRASPLAKIFKFSEQFDPFFLAACATPILKGKLPPPGPGSKLRTVTYSS
jgi:hypothetical protein